MFQFQLGTIGRCDSVNFLYRQTFQFQLGTIGRILQIVCLEVVISFQSQLGTIGRKHRSRNDCSRERFQFQLGTIGRETTAFHLLEILRFNSSLVRLGATGATALTLANRFQFQLGTIGRDRKSSYHNCWLVSIPAWYDWELCSGLHYLLCLDCFNSSLVRLGVFVAPVLGVVQCGFNSSLVRLGVNKRQDWFYSMAFQFQLGTIGR